MQMDVVEEVQAGTATILLCYCDYTPKLYYCDFRRSPSRTMSSMASSGLRRCVPLRRTSPAQSDSDHSRLISTRGEQELYCVVYGTTMSRFL